MLRQSQESIAVYNYILIFYLCQGVHIKLTCPRPARGAERSPRIPRQPRNERKAVIKDAFAPLSCGAGTVKENKLRARREANSRACHRRGQQSLSHLRCQPPLHKGAFLYAILFGVRFLLAQPPNLSRIYAALWAFSLCLRFPKGPLVLKGAPAQRVGDRGVYLYKHVLYVRTCLL